MLKNPRSLLAVALATALLLVGCGGEGSSGTTDSLSALDQYRKDVKPLVKQVRALAANYAEVSGDNYTTDRKLYNVVQRDLPKWVSLSQEIEAVESEDSEVQDAHDLFIDMTRSNVRAMTLLLAALEAQDYSQIADVNDELNKARDLEKDYVDAMKELRANA